MREFRLAPEQKIPIPEHETRVDTTLPADDALSAASRPSGRPETAQVIVDQVPLLQVLRPQSRPAPGSHRPRPRPAPCRSTAGSTPRSTAFASAPPLGQAYPLQRFRLLRLIRRVDRRDVRTDVDRVRAEFVRGRIDRCRIGRDIGFGRHVKQERLLHRRPSLARRASFSIRFVGALMPSKLILRRLRELNGHK